ncbi:hypothetical protein I3760_02G079400 [Carya illinoinensis]|nr:hypothetical protein I3760_02G079400 [Carya illinoinensis]
MIPELEKPRVTEIQVRMDCNGCVQKIKKALHGINGIYDFYIDFSQQKLTIIGWADPEKIVKALKKTRKIATICSHMVPTEPPAPPTEQAPQEGGGPAPDAPNPPPPEVQPAEPAPPPDPRKDPPAPPENPPADTAPPPGVPDNNVSQPTGKPTGPKDVGEVHVIYRHPPDHGYKYNYSQGYSGDQHKYHTGQGLPQEPPQPMYVTHNYNTYRPSPYVTEYEYVQSPPRRIHYNRMDHYSDDNHNNNSSNVNIISIFSEENPNACRIM